MGNTTLSNIIDDVSRDARTLTVYDATDPSAVSAVERHFEVQNVAVEEESVPDGPDDFVVLHDDGEFLAAADLDVLRQAVTFESGLFDASDFEDTMVPEVLKHVDDATFTAYGKRQMILGSREIEERAWRENGGELHAGFQHLSLLREQWNLYERLGERDVEVNAYGTPDWQPPETDWLTVNDEEADEIRNSWFVVFDAPGTGDCALLAEEREVNEFAGFWTYDESIVGDVLGHLRSRYG